MSTLVLGFLKQGTENELGGEGAGMQQRDHVGAGGRLLLSGLGRWLLWSWDLGLSQGISAEPFPPSPRAHLPAQGAERWVLPLQLAGGH